jgi:hypothetical protein
MKHFAVIYYSVAYYVNNVVCKYEDHSIKEIPVFETEDDVKNWLKDLETILGDEFKNRSSRSSDIRIMGVTLTNIVKL